MNTSYTTTKEHVADYRGHSIDIDVEHYSWPIRAGNVYVDGKIVDATEVLDKRSALDLLSKAKTYIDTNIDSNGLIIAGIKNACYELFGNFNEDAFKSREERLKRK